MESLKGKRLLILGGTAIVAHIVNKAHEMGVYTIVTDYIKDAPAKKLADKAYDISILDEDKVIELAKAEKVDGVFTGYADITLAPCARICEALGLPFYATEAQLDRTMNKNNFKALCRRFDISAVKDVDVLNSKYEDIKYPIIIKPADSYSSRGISVCYEPGQVEAAVKKALGFSKCGQIVSEEYIENAPDVYMYFTVQNGLVSLSAMADRLLNHDQYGMAPQPVGYFFPSVYIELYNEQIKDKLQRMMDSIGFKNGSFFLQGFVVDGQIVLFEMGLRLSGGAGYLLIAHENEIDQVKMHIRYALTGRFEGWDLKEYDDPKFKRPHCVMVVLLKNGVIGKVDGLEDVLSNDNVFDIVQFRHEGDNLSEAGTLNQVFARIYCYADDKDGLLKVIDYIKTTLKISNTEGENMILNFFDDSEIKQEM